MASPLVGTKLSVPRTRPAAVVRPRLLARLDDGARGRLTVVSAPAGFGKTTVLATWLERTEDPRPVAWLSLDEGDGQPTTFWAYVVAAMQVVAPSVGAGSLPLLQAGRVPTQTLLATVLNDLLDLPTGLHLILDDYHLAVGSEIAAGLAYFLEHLPPQVHLVISTRADPDLPLARLRARGELVEVRAQDLRFTVDEVAAYLGTSAGLDLPLDAVAALAERTEGWIAALQLALLSLRDRSDVADFVTSFTGDDRYIVDYLVEEVLARQPQQLRTFLLRTSVLDRLTGPLCDAVTGQDGGKATLESLDRANLFVTPLDDQRTWYRYHRLFADVLRTHLNDEQPDEVAQLHQRASQWYDRAGEPVAAVHHAVSSGDLVRAADLIEAAVPALRRDRREGIILGWIDDLPAEAVRARPVLAVGFIGALMAGNQFTDVERRLREVEQHLPTANGDGPEWVRLPAAVELYRAGLALVSGDVAATLHHARLATELAAPGDDVLCASASGLSALAHWTSGRLDAAHDGYATCIEGLRRAGHLSDVLGCSIAQADLHLTQGHLRAAVAVYERALALAAQSDQLPRGVADLHAGLAQVALERGDLTTARHHLQLSRQFGERLGLPQYPYRWRAIMATLREAEGDPFAAVGLLEDAERVYLADFSPNARPLGALRARALVAADRLDEAARWVQARQLTLEDDLSYLREFEHLTLLRVLLATARPGQGPMWDRMVEFGERLLAAADEAGRAGSSIEQLVVLSLLHQAAGDHATALGTMQEALTRSEPEGASWVFAREGRPLVRLLTPLADRAGPGSFARLVLAATHRHTTANSTVTARPEAADSPASRAPGSPQAALSAREADVLRLLATDLSGPEIAQHLVVSLNTLRTHTRSIYTKLGVTSRRTAVSRAREVGLLSAPRRS